MQRTLQALRARVFTVPLRSQARSVSSLASAATPAASSSSSRLLLGLLLGGGAVLGAHSLIGSARVEAAAARTDSDGARVQPARAAASEKPEPPAKLHHVSDLAQIDFRTIGACDCPDLPERAPRWLQQLREDAGFQYRDVVRLLDTRGHFLFDALQGDRRLSEFYYFTEKVEPTPRPADGETHPHLAPSLTFEPAAAKVPEPVAEAEAAAAARSEKKRHAPATPAAISASPAAATPPPPPAAFSSGPMMPLLTATGPEVRAVFHVGSALCGHRGIVHGGLTAALMDDVSGAATFVASGGGNFTANLTINYIAPVPADRYLLVRAQAVKQDRRKTYVNISVEDGQGKVFARGTALYVKPKMLPPAVMLAATH